MTINIFRFFWKNSTYEWKTNKSQKTDPNSKNKKSGLMLLSYIHKIECGLPRGWPQSRTHNARLEMVRDCHP